VSDRMIGEDVLRELNTVRVLAIAVLGLQVLSILISLVKLVMMRSVADTMRINARSTDQYIQLTQQYADLYTREVRECEHTVMSAARAISETVLHPADSFEITTPEQAVMLQTKLDTWKKRKVPDGK